MASSHGPFGTIESAQAFLGLLGTAIDEAIDEARREFSSCVAHGQQQRSDAWRLVLYKMNSLSSDVAHSRRLVDEVQTLKRYLHRTDVVTQGNVVHLGAAVAVGQREGTSGSRWVHE